MNVKICGVTCAEDVARAVKHGAFAVGFNFVDCSPRCLTTTMAKPLIAAVPASVLSVGVCVNATVDEMVSLRQALSLDLIQVYGVVDCSDAEKHHMILALNLQTGDPMPSARELDAYAYVLLDAPVMPEGPRGGTGRRGDWMLAQRLASRHRLILAGGLTADNVREAIDTVRPFGIDVASGVEARPGVQDPARVSQFFQEIYDAK